MAIFHTKIKPYVIEFIQDLNFTLRIQTKPLLDPTFFKILSKLFRKLTKNGHSFRKQSMYLKKLEQLQTVIFKVFLPQLDVLNENLF